MGDIALSHIEAAAEALIAVLSAKGQTVEQRPDWEVADIPCKAVYQWPASQTLGAAQHA